MSFPSFKLSPNFIIFKECFLLATFSGELFSIQYNNLSFLFGIFRPLALNAFWLMLLGLNLSFAICFLFASCALCSLHFHFLSYCRLISCSYDSISFIEILTIILCFFMLVVVLRFIIYRFNLSQCILE